MISFEWDAPWWLMVTASLAVISLFLLLFRGRNDSPWIFLFPCIIVFALLFQLISPTLVNKQKIFQKPLIIVAVDKSNSYQAGEFLGIANKVDQSISHLKVFYDSLGFEIKTIYFANSVFLDPLKNNEYETNITSFESLWSYVSDSLKIKAKGVFLFSDGRETNLSTLKTLPVKPGLPVFPILHTVDSIIDIQMDSLAVIREDDELTKIRVLWQVLSPEDSLKTKIHLIQNGKKIFTKDLNWYGEQINEDEIIINPRWNGKLIVSIDAVINEKNQFNNSLSVDIKNIKNTALINLERNPRTLDARWYSQILIKAGYDVDHIKIKKIINGEKGINGPIWMGSYQLKKQIVRDFLDTTKKRVVIYDLKQQNLKRWKQTNTTWNKLSGKSSLIFKKGSKDFFYGIRGKAETFLGSSTSLPKMDSTMESLAEIGNNGHGLIFKIANREIYFLGTNNIWRKLFSPDVSWEKKENIRSIISGLAKWIQVHSEKVQIKWNETVVEGVPFSFSAFIKGGLNKTHIIFSGNSKEYKFVLKSKTLKNGQLHSHDSLLMEKGSYDLQLKTGEQILWEGRTEVKALLEIERSKIGYDNSFLKKISKESGGEHLILHPDKTSQAPWPILSVAQESHIFSKRRSLFNTKWSFFLIILLFTVYWVFRKRRGLD